jgi:hypothetical protein
MVAVVRLLKVTNANPLPPSEVLQSRVTLLGLGCCARALDPGEQKNVAANAVTTNILGRFIEFSFGFLNVSSELAPPHLPHPDWGTLGPTSS